MNKFHTLQMGPKQIGEAPDAGVLIGLNLATEVPASMARDAREIRARAAAGIIWRGAAIDPATVAESLWDLSNEQAAGLNTTRLEEHLERRLRTVERLRFQVGNDASWGTTDLKAIEVDGTFIWDDGTTHRIFDFPTWAKPTGDA